jgi:hypothetical protein
MGFSKNKKSLTWDGGRANIHPIWSHDENQLPVFYELLTHPFLQLTFSSPYTHTCARFSHAEDDISKTELFFGPNTLTVLP